MVRTINLLSLILVAALAVSTAGCIGGGSSYTGDSGQGIAEDLPDSGDVNPFNLPSDGDDDGDDDGLFAEDLGAPVDASKTAEASIDALKILTDPEDLSSVHAKAGEDYVSELIEVIGGSGEGFEWTHDLPAGFDLVPYNDSASRVQIENVEDVTEAMVGEHAVTLIATDEGNGQSVSFSFVLTIDTSLMSVHLSEDYVDPCTLPLTIELVNASKSGTLTAAATLWDGGAAEEGPSSAEELSATLGTRNFEMEFKAMRGNTPARDVTWSWESKVKESLHCLNASYYAHSSMDAYNLFADLKRNEYMYHYRIDNGLCVNEHVDEDFEEVPGFIEPVRTVNESWHPQLRFSGSHFTLVGDLVYRGPLPVKKFRKDDGRDDLNRRPVEQIVVSAADHCMKAAEGMRMLAPRKKVNINIDYPDESVENVKVRWEYKDKSIVGCAGGKLGLHLQKSLSRLNDTQMEDMSPKDADDWHEEYSLASRQYDLLDMANCKNDVCKTEWKKFVKNDDGYGVRTVGEALDLVLYLNLGGWVEACSMTDCTTTYPDLDIREIQMKSNYWYAEYDDDDDDYFDNNVIKKSDNGVFRDYRLTAFATYSGMTMPSVRCAGGECPKASIFRRRDFPKYD